MGTIQHKCVIATTYDQQIFEEVIDKLTIFSEEFRRLFIVSPMVTNAYQTIILTSCGSKHGWAQDLAFDNIREKFIRIIEDYDFEDGSNPFSFVELSYGELGQAIKRGNCDDQRAIN